METNKFVTAIVVVFNGEKYLRQCIDSILNQDYQPLEILVIDDGSTDSTMQIIKSYGKKIRSYHQVNSGIAEARNKGIELANGDYIAFLDADDIWIPGKISTQITVFRKYPHYDVVYGNFKRISASVVNNDLETQPMKPEIDKNWSGCLYPRMLMDSWVHIITAMAPKKIFIDVGGFDPDKKIGEDYDFWIRVSKKYKMTKIPYPLALYRDNPSSITARFTERNYGAEIVKKYISKYGLSDPNGGEISKKQIRKRLHQLWFMHGYIARNNGRYPAAARSFIKALKYDLVNLSTYRNILYALYKMGRTYEKRK